MGVREKYGARHDCDKSDRSDQTPAVHGIPLAELRDLAGPNWPEIEFNPRLLDVFARAVADRLMRKRGKVPAHYTATTTCAHCGPVPIFEGAPDDATQTPET